MHHLSGEACCPPTALLCISCTWHTKQQSVHVCVGVAILTCMDSPLFYLEATEAKRQHRNSSEQLLTEVRDLVKMVAGGFGKEVI